MFDFLEELDKELKDIKIRLDNLERDNRNLQCEIDHIEGNEEEEK